MSRPWMPLYIADYLADTAHLKAAESGAYLHLIMHYWQKGSLPKDDARLALIAKMSPAEWSSARPTIAEFFEDGWVHQRIIGELAEADRLSKAGKKGGEASAEKRKRTPRPKGDAGDSNLSTDDQRSGNQTTNDPPTISQPPQPPPQKVGVGGDVAPLIRPQANEIAEDLAVIAGYPDIQSWPPSWCGAALYTEKWLAEGWKPEIILITARQVMSGKRDGPPASVVFFERAIARAHARHAAPVPQVIIDNSKPEIIRGSDQGYARTTDRNGGGERSGLAAIDRVFARVAEAERTGIAGPDENTVQLLPARSIP